MKKVSGQVSIALVCCLLGFMVTYQLKVINKRNQSVDTSKNNPEIVVEIEKLKKEKKKLEYKVNDLQYKIREYENKAVGRDDITKRLKDELDNYRVLLGETDVKGEGIVLYLTPKSDIFNVGVGSEPNAVNDRDLIYIVNELYSSGAEAVSINDIRLTLNSGIRNAGGSILIDGSNKISPKQRIVIKAIGDKTVLESTLGFPGGIPANLYELCEVKFNSEDDISIKKSSKVFKFNYAKTVKKE
ncbi:DUF881 domain-containing protein [Haloimpatiens sp. FM7330]|uniref:DUF881 domain-containing protein n=1 Tax=Haloimpatiens sp. FM7330 TaxID=3298610 RepID=UPI003643F971